MVYRHLSRSNQNIVAMLCGQHNSIFFYIHVATWLAVVIPRENK